MSDATQLTLTAALSPDSAILTARAVALPVPCVECKSTEGTEYTDANGHTIRACRCGNVQSVYMPNTEPAEVIE